MPKPALRPDQEANFVDIDRRSAKCYQQLERVSAMARLIAQRLDDPGSAAPAAIVSDDTSLIVHLASAQVAGKAHTREG